MSRQQSIRWIHQPTAKLQDEGQTLWHKTLFPVGHWRLNQKLSVTLRSLEGILWPKASQLFQLDQVILN